MAFTSGTTGSPKAALHTHRDVLAGCEAWPRHVLRATPDDIVPMGRLAVEADNAGAGCGSGAACAPTALTARWVLRPQPGQALYALDVHWQGVLEGRPLKRHLLLEAGAARRYAIPVELVELF